MIYGSVCSGIEAATVAWHPLGWRPSFFSDVDGFARAALKHHYPEVPLHGRERRKGETLEDYAAAAGFQTIRGDEYAAIDLLVGGTPCQSFSVAGLRGGMADDRGNLALEFLRLADRTRPRWLVWENVPGVLSSFSGSEPPSDLAEGEEWEADETSDFGCFLAGLVELGYGVAYRVLDAQYFGVPQRRRRVFVVGYLGDWRPAAAVFFERHSLSGHPAPSRQTGQGVAACANDGVVGSLCADTHPGAYSGQDAYTGRLIAHTLRGEGFDAGGEQNGALVPVAFNWQGGGTQTSLGFDPSQDSTGTLSANTTPAIAFSCKDHGADAGDLAPTLRAMGHGDSHANAGGQVAVAWTVSESSGGFSWEKPVYPTLQTGHGGKQQSGLRIGSAVRRLTPRECERLQGFPDDYTLVPHRGKPAADGPRYKALGNSMAVPVMRWIGERIDAVEAILAARAAA